MAIQDENKGISSAYVNDLLSAEKNLFLLKLIRDGIQNKYNECKRPTSAPQDITPEEPKPVECKLKRVPEKPVKNDAKGKTAFWENIILKSAVVFCILLFADFIAVLFSTGFLNKPMSESGVYATLLNIFMILTVCCVVGFIALHILEHIQYKEDIRSWLAIKEQIEQHNLEEIKKAEELTRLQAQQYYKNAEAENARRIADTFEANARADVYELQKAKINSTIQSTEKLLAKLYPATAIPYSFRRIDSIFTLELYMQSNNIGLKTALKMYTDAVSNGELAEYFSDITDNKAKYAEAMPEFSEYMAVAEEKAQAVIKEAVEIATLIAGKAVNKNTGAVNTGIIATEFHKLFDEAPINNLLADIAEQNNGILQSHA